MKRRGFYLPSVMLAVVLIMAVAGVMVRRVSAHATSVAAVVGHRKALEASQIGLKAAEDWLLGALLRHDVPRGYSAVRPGVGTERISARLFDGSGVVWRSQFAGCELDLYVADADYPEGLFSPNGTAIPRIPPEVTPLGTCRYYFLQSTARTTPENIPITCEELLAVSMDAAGNVSDARRLFYRSK